jgi:surface antigen
MRRIIPGLPGRRVPRWPFIAAVLLLATPAAAFAQYGTTFRNTPMLSKSDVATIRTLVSEKLATQPIGTTMAWSNPETENSGTVTLLDRFTSEGRNCRRIRYQMNPGPKQPSNVKTTAYAMTSCQLPDGTWKFDNQATADAAR